MTATEVLNLIASEIALADPDTAVEDILDMICQIREQEGV